MSELNLLPYKNGYSSEYGPDLEAGDDGTGDGSPLKENEQEAFL